MPNLTSSSINETGVNAEYPVAGQDNDSQGFRDNFSILKTNFVAAKTEIEELQDITAKLNDTNDFLGNNISGANLVNNTHAHHPSAGTVNSSQNINVSDGPHQSIVVGADVTLTLTNWNTNNDKANTVRVYVKTADVDRTVTFASNAGAGTLKRSSNWPTANTTAIIAVKADPADADKFFVFEFTSFDQGATVWSNYVGVYQ